MPDTTAGMTGDSFFSNRECSHFPCHEGVPAERFNCLLCYCPLYLLGAECGGSFTYTDAGVKDCSGCAIPHDGDAGVRLVQKRFSEIAARASRTQA